MTTKDKVWLIVLALLDNRNADKEIIAHSGNKLDKSDLDRLFKSAENIIDKAITKPEERPRGKVITEACRSWLDYYDWPD
jgi:hypothetical protein